MLLNPWCRSHLGISLMCRGSHLENAQSCLRCCRTQSSPTERDSALESPFCVEFNSQKCKELVTRGAVNGQLLLDAGQGTDLPAVPR